ncbi:pyruvate kinase [Sphaerisporangium sp. NPDC049002]|uniref:pyruvate kinase n=1 Tax=Sphaerisporangium sp. NPDC049002 TaxID=3155392 RepID=UPI003403DB9E
MTHLWITLGPSSLGLEAELFSRGATGSRLTFSYGTPELQLERARTLRKAAQEVNRTSFTVADLAGEKFRLGEFTGRPSIPVTPGCRFVLASGASSDPEHDGALPVPDQSFFGHLTLGDVITVGDGGAELTVVDLDGALAGVEAVSTGVIDQTRGLTVRGNDFRPRALTTKDRSDLRFVAQHEEFDAVALSFVSSARDVMDARDLLGGRDITLIAKIETALGVANIREICAVADMVMAARGDLALSIPWVELPEAVERIAEGAAGARIPWILATQVAEGLERFSLPTRAEICDLAHWLAQGCAGVLLSYETVFGRNAIGAVSAVDELIGRWSTSDVTGAPLG